MYVCMYVCMRVCMYVCIYVQDGIDILNAEYYARITMDDMKHIHRSTNETVPPQPIIFIAFAAIVDRQSIDLSTCLPELVFVS